MIALSLTYTCKDAGSGGTVYCQASTSTAQHALHKNLDEEKQTELELAAVAGSA